MKLDIPFDAETKNWKKRFLVSMNLPLSSLLCPRMRTVKATFRGHLKVKDPFPAGAGANFLAYHKRVTGWIG